ncbi:hypothetical protein KAI68_00225 [bacterium]|nr:hypothetical protein [bacterium]
MDFLLRFVGYLVNSVIVLFTAVLLIKIFVHVKKKEIGTIPMGTAIKELTDFILKKARLFLPIKGEVTLSVTTVFVLIGLFCLVKRWMIG